MDLMPFAAPVAYESAVAPPEGAAATAAWFVFRETSLLVTEALATVPRVAGAPAHGSSALPRSSHPGALGLAPLREQYLGTLGELHLFAAEVDAAAEPPPGWRWQGLRALFGVLDDSLFALAGRALQIVDWDRTHQFCGRCATPTRHTEGERSRECPACALVAYPRLAPAVMALVRRSPDEILLARSPRFPEGMYSALAGFVEPGETLEQCLAREVLEEVGVRVRDAQYFASQPWPFPHSLMIAFVCDWEFGEISTNFLEIEAAQWFKIHSLPRLPQRISIARRLIDAVVREMSEAAR